MKKTIAIYIPRIQYIKNYVDPYMKFLFSEFEYNILVLHTSSLEGDYTENTFGSDYIFVDISYSNITKLISIIDIYKPTVFIIQSFRSLMDIILIRVFNKIKLQIIYLEHGLVMNKSLGFKGKFIFALKKYFFYFKKLLSLLIYSNFDLYELIITGRAFIKTDYSKLFIDYYLLYALSTKKILSRVFDMTTSKIINAGYPICNTEPEFQKLYNMPIENKITFIH